MKATKNVAQSPIEPSPAPTGAVATEYGLLTCFGVLQTAVWEVENRVTDLGMRLKPVLKPGRKLRGFAHEHMSPHSRLLQDVDRIAETLDDILTRLDV